MHFEIDESRNYVASLIEEKVIPVLAAKAHEARQIIESKVGPAIHSIAENDSACTVVFEGIYQLLPAPIRFVLKREAFVGYCLSNKAKILSLIDSKTPGQPLPAAISNPP